MDYATWYETFVSGPEDRKQKEIALGIQFYTKQITWDEYNGLLAQLQHQPLSMGLKGSPHQLQKGKKMKAVIRCAHCWKIFNLANENEASEWYYGHDCEAVQINPIDRAPAPSGGSFFQGAK